MGLVSFSMTCDWPDGDSLWEELGAGGRQFLANFVFLQSYESQVRKDNKGRGGTKRRRKGCQANSYETR